MNQFPAHIRVGANGEEHIQPNTAHCRQVAAYAAASLSGVGLAATGRLAGLVHDAGKFTAAFTAYIEKAARKQNPKRGSVNHTFAGVRLLFERCYTPQEPSLRNMACEILAFAAGAHHGLFDCVDNKAQSGFEHRLTAEGTGYEEARQNFFALCAAPAEIDALFEEAVAELTTLLETCKAAVQTEQELQFCLSLLCRLVLSAVIDADRQDTAEFTYNTTFAKPPENRKPLWAALLTNVEAHIATKGSGRPIDALRAEISQQCGTFSAKDGGIYRLSVPTGSGKTLAALRFALQTAGQYNKTRIVLATPLLSILEQNAKAVKEAVQRDEVILEHHSNVINIFNKDDELDENELLTETWGASLIITTTFQLLHTLFRAETTCVRRFGALAGSVIVLDEVQALPRHMITQFNLALNFLAYVCGATVVLCSATQPSFETAVHPLRLETPQQLVPPTPGLFAAFRRTLLIDRTNEKPGGHTFEELAALAIDALPKARSVLLICNTKNQAARLFALLQHTDAAVFHLSTSMCMAHRQSTLNSITDALDQTGTRAICVATQLVEAGVDFSFGCVIRVLAGLDNLIQAAGRCNRHGEFGFLCPVYVVTLKGEDLSCLPEIQQAQNAARALLEAFRQNPARFGGELASQEAIAFYYRNLFQNMHLQEQDYPASKNYPNSKNHSVVKENFTLFSLLSNNADFRKQTTLLFPLLGQAFKTAGEAFMVFGYTGIDVLVPYGEGQALIEELGSKFSLYDTARQKELLKKARRFSVTIFGSQRSRLEEAGGLAPLCGGTVLALLPAFYLGNTGLTLALGYNSFLEVPNDL